MSWRDLLAEVDGKLDRISHLLNESNLTHKRCLFVTPAAWERYHRQLLKTRRQLRGIRTRIISAIKLEQGADHATRC